MTVDTAERLWVDLRSNGWGPESVPDDVKPHGIICIVDTPENLAKSATVQRMVGALRDAVRTVIEDLQERVSDFPKHTCSDIDRTIREVRPVAKAAYGKSGEGNDFADDVDTLLRDLPSALEDLRGYNHQLRESLHEALASRKSAVSKLEDALDAALRTKGPTDE